jgi:hypothetical protein
MKYRVGGQGWPVGAQLIPASTLVDTALPQWAFLADINPPMDAQPQDETTYNWMVKGCRYPSHLVKPVPL